MSTQTNCQRLHAHGFLIHLGFMYPPKYGEALVATEPTVQNKTMMPIDVILSRSSRKLRRGIIATVKAGLTDSESFEILKKRGFAKKYKSEKNITLKTFKRYIKIARDVTGIARKRKCDLIIEYFNAGLDESDISKKVDAQIGYIRTIISEKGIRYGKLESV